MKPAKLLTRSTARTRPGRRRLPGDASAGLPHETAPRDASTLLIVMVLLGMLSLIGFMFYTFAANERSTASYWADSQKNVGQAQLDADALMDWGLQQLIIGPGEGTGLTHSALYGPIYDSTGDFRFGSRHSMLANMFGPDIHPYNSAGIHLMSLNGEPFADMNFNNIADNDTNANDDTDGDAGTDETPLNNTLLDFNDSAAANGGAAARVLTNWPDPGVDYTYPDINNLFLAYKGFAVDASGNTVPVIIPSFHRPQLLRGAGGLPVADWYNNAAYAGRVMRPHPSHLNPDGTTRFPTAVGGTTLTTTFPFAQGAAPTFSEQGVWSLSTAYDPINTVVPDYEYDVDNDNDTINEGIWMDLQYPVQTDGAGQTFVPLFSFTVYSADGLFNLNAHGNLAALADVTDLGDIPGLSRLLAGSNQGLSTNEINPQYGLNAAPNTDTTVGDYVGTQPDLVNELEQHTFQYGWTPNNNVADVDFERRRLSNMEWYRLIAGTANFQSATEFSDLYTGRNGEPFAVLYPGLLQGIANGSVSQTPVSQMPFPGVTGLDDNWNQYEGAFAWELYSGVPGYSKYDPSAALPFVYQYNSSYAPKFFPNSLAYYAPYPYGQPLDFDGNGTIAGVITRNGSNQMVLSTGQTGSGAAGSNFGKNRLMVRNVYGQYKSLPYPAYLRYDNPGGVATYSQAGTSDTTNLNSVAAGWHNGTGTLGGEQMSYPVQIGGIWYAAPYLSGSTPPLAQLDEGDETIVDAKYATSSDALFDFSENAGLHLSASDRTNLSLASRVRLLASFNMGTDANKFPRGDSIAQQFTTESADRKQYGYGGTAGDNYVNGLPSPTDSAIYTPLPGYAIPGDHLIFRPWEMSDVNTDSVRETFPPVFGSAAAYSATDPFRPPVRQLLSMTMGNGTPTNQIQFRLSLNHLTTYDSTNNLIQRGLTPHDPALTEVGGTAQEVQARLDRQQMARDIYVMLYTFGGGLDFAMQNNHGGTSVGAGGYTGDNSTFNLYNARQLREMAQFAVNVVDALDSDRVMTKFEYDKNLGDGWELDDNAYTIDPGFTPYLTSDPLYNADYPEDSDERGVVYGVEAQEITINEVLAFFCPEIQSLAGTATDHAATAHDDSHDRYFTYIELRNVGMTAVNFNGQYRLRAIPDPINGTGVERRLTLLQHADNVVPAGDLFTIGNAGEEDIATGPAPLIEFDTPVATRPSPPDDLNHSRFRCENSTSTPGDFTTAPAWIAPNQQELDLDLIVDRDDNKFILSEVNGTNITVGPTALPGGFLNRTTLAANADSPETITFNFVLERRQYPDRPATDPTNFADNPWIPVDRFELAIGDFRRFGLQNSDSMPSEYDDHLDELLSKERIEPLRRGYSNDLTADGQHAPAIVANSLMGENSNAPANFALYQDRTDRPFASPVELFEIPLYGPQNVTRWNKAAVASATYNPSPFSQTTELELEYQSAATAGSQNEIPTAATAVAKFLQPEHIENLNGNNSPKEPVLDNRWYRLLEFYEVPSRRHRQLGNPLEFVRQPAKLALNTIRHPAVFAGLLDDPDVMSFENPSAALPTLLSTDGDARDWWRQFLQSRDGRLVDNGTTLDKQADSVTGLFLPGLADSTPFRSPSKAGFVKTATRQSPQDALESTIFRKLPIDATTAPLDPRHLWEVGTAADHAGSSGTIVDSVMRHRLLSKIYNNTTTRSHVFIVFVTVRMFEADNTNGDANVRIGGPLDPQVQYRGFFLIDRSQPEDAYDAATNTFSNFRNLIKYRTLLP